LIAFTNIRCHQQRWGSVSARITDFGYHFRRACPRNYQATILHGRSLWPLHRALLNKNISRCIWLSSRSAGLGGGGSNLGNLAAHDLDTFVFL